MSKVEGTASRTSLNHHMNLKLLYLVLVIYSVNVGILVTIIPLYTNSIGVNEVAVGVVVSAYAIAYVAASPLWGKASDLLGGKLALGIGMLGCSAVIPLFSIARDPSQLVLVRLFHGFADSSFWVVPTIIVTSVYAPKERGMALGKIGTLQGMGFIIGPLLGGLLSENLGYINVFYMCSGFAFLTALLAFSGSQTASKAREENTHKVRSRFKIAATKNLAIAYFHTALSAVFFGVIVSQFVLHANVIVGQEYLVGFLLTGYYIAETFIQPAAGKLSDSIGRHSTILLAFVMCAFGFLMLISPPSFFSFSIAIVIIGGGVGGLYVSLTAFLMDVTSDSQHGLVAGMQNLAWGIGYFLGPLIGGVAAATSFSATYTLCTIASTIGALSTPLLRYRFHLR